MSKPETWKSWEGRQIDGKFPLRQWLGGSDHSAVFLTELPGTPPQKAAIKLVPCEGGAATETQVRSLKAKIGLRHPNLIEIFEAGRAEVDGECAVYSVMEFADDNLGQILPERTLEPEEVTELLPPLLKALSYLHEKGLVHSRIMPSNILAAGDQLKLSADQVRSTSEQKPGGRKDEYDAPETALGTLSPASDVWSLGMTLVAAFTQRISFSDNKTQADPAVPGNVPEPYRSIAAACLRRDPKQRCSIREIEQRLKGQTQPAARPAAAPAPAVMTPAPATIRAGEKKRPGFPLTIGLAVVLGIVFAVFYFGKSKSPTPSTDTQQPAVTPAPASQSVEPSPSPAKPQDANGNVLHQVLPEIPQSAKNTITGTIKVVAQAQVDASGKVTSVKFKSPGSSRYFANLAMKAAHEWVFTPPQVNGQPAPSTWLIQFRFRRSGTQASAQKARD